MLLDLGITGEYIRKRLAKRGGCWEHIEWKLAQLPPALAPAKAQRIIVVQGVCAVDQGTTDDVIHHQYGFIEFMVLKDVKCVKFDVGRTARHHVLQHRDYYVNTSSHRQEHPGQRCPSRPPLANLASWLSER